MRILVTGGAGFIGRAVVARLADRGDEVTALVRDPARAGFLARDGVTLVASDLSDPAALRDTVAGADAVIHAAGSYRVGVPDDERPAMWDANVGTTERVLDAAIEAGAPRIVYVSTNGIHGNTRGAIVDETYRRPPADGFLSWYDETKLRAHEAAEARIGRGAPVIIVQPGQTFGPHDHSAVGAQLAQAHAGRLRAVAFGDAGLAWAHVDDLAGGLLAALDRGRIGEAYSLGGECLRLRDALAVAARIGGHRPPLLTVPTRLLRLVAPVNDRVGGLPGMPSNLHEAVEASDGVTYWVSNAKAGRELGYAPRTVEQGIGDTFGRAGTGARRG